MSKLKITGLALLGVCFGFATTSMLSATDAAQVDDRKFSLEEVDERVKEKNSQLFNQLYDARKTAVDGLIADYLLEREAKKRGISKDALITKEITSKITSGDRGASSHEP